MNENIYKIGRTEKINSYNRIKCYDKDSILYFILPVKDSLLIENLVIQEFNNIFEKTETCSKEEYKGDLDQMIKLIIEIYNKYDMNIIPLSKISL